MSTDEAALEHGDRFSRARLRSNSYDQAIAIDDDQPTRPVPKNPPSGRKASELMYQDDDIHLIKWIEFHHGRLPILLQNINGPCPLLAVANVLLLTQRIRLNPNANAISADHMVADIADYILRTKPTNLSNEHQATYETNVQEALHVLDKLKTGIDVNVKFHGVNQFEYTRECVVFDLLGIDLLHGWIIDPQNRDLQRIVGSDGSSYNQLIEKMIRQRSASQEELVRESLLIQQFLDDNRSQLTYYGLLKLNEAMHEDQLAVLFRNNHFSTIWKIGGQLLLLVSDQGYLDHTSIVFETLTGIDNDSVFTDGYGRKWQNPAMPHSSRDRDRSIAIQSEEQLRYLRAQHVSRSNHQAASKHRRKQASRDRHDNCNLL